MLQHVPMLKTDVETYSFRHIFMLHVLLIVLSVGIRRGFFLINAHVSKPTFEFSCRVSLADSVWDVIFNVQELQLYSVPWQTRPLN